MGTGAARSVTRRPRWRAYLLLARLSNLPTVWTNVLAGLTLAGGGVAWPLFAHVAAAMSLMYTGGMFLNDAFDRDVDAARRSDRPIPSGDVRAPTVFIAGFALLAAGLAAMAAGRFAPQAILWTLGLAAAIVYYDYRHKRDPLGPVVMGICRGLVYCVAAASVVPAVPPRVMVAAAAMTAYVVALTWVAKRAGPSAGWLIPVLIAGISLVDAAFIGLSGGGAARASLAAAAFVLTLLLQRVVPGT
jgi:4-hydroxybenzoate polyprenyltransferase